MMWMGATYIGFATVVFLGFCRVAVTEKLPWWWAPLVLFLPPLALFFVARMKREGKKANPLLWSAAILGGLAMVAGIEVYLYQDYKEKNKYSHLPPVVREMIQRNDAVMASTIALYNASGKLDSLGLVQSRKTDIKTTLELIDQMRKLIAKNTRDIDSLVDYISSHEELLRRQHLDWAFSIGSFYRDPHVTRHNRSREGYFNSFEEMLRYTYDNFEAIMELKSPRQRANYDAYYLRYRGVADRHNQVNRERIRFQNRFVAEHPDVKPFLPGTHHLEPFKFWDRFSF